MAKKQPPELVSIREFARRLKTTETSVRKAIKAGKIAAIDYTNPKRPQLEFESAKAEWAAKFAPEKIQNMELANKLGVLQGADQSAEDSDGNLIINNSAPYLEAQRITQVFKAKTAQLEYNEKRGSLVEKDAVYKEYFAIAQSVRASMQSLPDKIVDHIIAELNVPIEKRAEVHKLMYNEITEALEALSMKPQFK